MKPLSETDLSKAAPYLEDALLYMREHDGNLPTSIERSLLKAFWLPPHATQLLKEKIMRMSLHPLYKYVAVRYIENPDGGPGLDLYTRAEFQKYLREAYGVAELNPSTMKEDRLHFWAGFNSL